MSSHGAIGCRVDIPLNFASCYIDEILYERGSSLLTRAADEVIEIGTPRQTYVLVSSQGELANGQH